MIYNFACECGMYEQTTQSIHEDLQHPICGSCGMVMLRNWQADRPQLNTQACKDHDDIPHNKRVVRGSAPGSAHKEEATFQKHITERRKELADGGNRGGLRHTHSVPADLYHGKIRETGDKNYWSDPANLNRHNSCKVD